MTHNEKMQHILAVLQEYAPTGTWQQRCADLGTEDTPEEQLKRLVGTLYDGLAYGNWPWTDYRIDR